MSTFHLRQTKIASLTTASANTIIQKAKTNNMDLPTKENTLYLPIKQVYFDQIIGGTKKEEFREIKEGITANRYLLKGEDGKYVLNPKVTKPGKEYFVDDYNNGKFPFMPKQYKYLALAVGYAKERDTAIVEVIGFKFVPEMIRSNLYAFWVIAFQLGRVVELKRKSDKPA
jgi:hypothetical protein